MNAEYTYVSTQATNCASCGLHKHTPLRVDWMGGYVCLSCIDRVMESIPAAPPLDDDNAPIIYDTNEVDQLTYDLTGNEGEDDSVTVLRRLAAYVKNVWPGKTALQVLIELEERTLGVTPYDLTRAAADLIGAIAALPEGMEGHLESLDEPLSRLRAALADGVKVRAPGNLGDPGMPTEHDLDEAFHDAIELVELTDEQEALAREWFSVGALEFAARARAAGVSLLDGDTK